MQNVKAAPAKAAPATDAATDATAPVSNRGLAKAAATVDAGATFFAQYSDRDSAFLAFFGTVMRGNGDSASLADIQKAGKPAPTKSNPNRTINPFYAGPSALSIDGGAINRLIADGYFTKSESGNRLTATAKAKATALYTGTK